MDAGSLIAILLVGAIAGWLAGLIMKGGGFGLLGNIIVGIIGAIVGGWLLGTLGVSLGIGGLVGAIIQGVLGAVVLLAIVGVLKRA